MTDEIYKLPVEEDVQEDMQQAVQEEVVEEEAVQEEAVQEETVDQEETKVEAEAVEEQVEKVSEETEEIPEEAEESSERVEEAAEQGETLEELPETLKKTVEIRRQENKPQASYIHIGCDKDEPFLEIFKRYGFSHSAYGKDDSLSELHESMLGARLAVIFESQDVLDGSRNMAYQVREALSCKREILIVCKKEYTDFAKKFEDERGVTVIKCGTAAEALHLLFVEKLCKMPELYSDADCARDGYGDIIHHAIDAWKGVAASEKYIADRYLSGEYLPLLSKQAVFWYTRAKEHGSLRAIVALGDCYFMGNGCPENKKKAYELYDEAANKNTPEGILKVGKCKLYGDGCDEDAESAYEDFRHAASIRREYHEAEYYIGLCLRQGLGTDKSPTEAKAHFLRSARGSFVPALIELGNLFSIASTDDYNPTLAFEYYSRAAAQDSAEGLYNRGIMLSSGVGTQKDEALARECFERGAAQKDMKCLCSLGICYEFGVGCEIDYKRAVSCYTQAADKAYAAAINNLGGCYYYGHGVPKSRKKALELFERAALFGDSNAMTRLGLCYEAGVDCQKDAKKAFGYFQRASQYNNAIAAYKTALCYESGEGVEQDFKRAFAHFELAAGLGHTQSMWHAANYLSDGVGTQRDFWAAFKWYSKGAEAGHADCYLQMAHFAFKGIGTVKNHAKAFFCYNKAFELGADKQETALRIGVCYLRGLGVQEDRAQALEWFKKSAATGSPDAIFLCGESYFFGSGCEQNLKVAVQYYTLAAKAEHTRAIVSLAKCYELGLGVPQSKQKAAVLYKRASKHDNPEANFGLASLIYENGGSEDSVRALLFRAANKGFVSATLMLGRFYEQGKGMPQNFDKAAENYLRAIALGMSKQKILLFSMPERDIEIREHIHASAVEATYRLGMLRGRHSRSVGDYTKAFEYIAGAAATGSQAAQAEIAKIYASGGDLQAYFRADKQADEPSLSEIGGAMNKLGDTWYEGKPLLQKNDRAAVKCYRIAANLGNSNAAYSLGWCLRHGVGVAVDDVEAAKWLKKSADLGNPHAAYSYGLCCEEGSGMEIPNLREAATYYRKAAAAGHADARKRHLKIMAKR